MKPCVRTLLVSVFLLLAVSLAPACFAHPQYFSDNCAGCHSNDTATCNGCHHHGPVGMTAIPDKGQYKCGEAMSITLDGGTKSGWIRAILYNQDGIEVARATGPTHMGDDSQPDPVTFPVVFVTTAPVGVGVYTWQAAWWGSPYDVGNTTVYPHGPEVRVPVEINVVGPSPVEDSTWGKIKALLR